MDNHEKQSTYASLKIKLKNAVRYGFWFEACMIEYAIIEDRTSSILASAAVCKNPYDKKLTNKLNSIELQIGKNHPVISKKVKVEEVALVRDWKEKRNDLVHRACQFGYNNEIYKEIAIQGKTVMDKMSNAAQRVARAYERSGTI